MNIPNESLVLIIASGGAIIVFFIAVSIFCICRRTRRSDKAVIHILSNPSQGSDDVEQAADQATWERNQLIPTARFLHSLNPNAKICAVGTSKSTWCPPVQSCIIEHSSSTNTSPASPPINQPPVNAGFSKTVCEEKPGSSTNHLRSTKSAGSQNNSCNIEKLFGPELCKNHEEITVLSQSSSTNHSNVQHEIDPLSTKERFSVPNVLSKQSPIHNVCSPELHPVEINKKRQSFHGASTSKETVKTIVKPLRAKRLDKLSNLHHSQASSLVNNCSNSVESPETRYSFHKSCNVKEARKFENRRLLRSHSFAGRSKISFESHSGRTEQEPSQVQKRKVRRNNSIISNTRQEQCLESQRTHPRIQRVLGLAQIAHSNVPGFSNVISNQEPSTSGYPTTESNNSEDVIVLDGSEPPPPYYS